MAESPLVRPLLPDLPRPAARVSVTPGRDGDNVIPFSPRTPPPSLHDREQRQEQADDDRQADRDPRRDRAEDARVATEDAADGTAAPRPAGPPPDAPFVVPDQDRAPANDQAVGKEADGIQADGAGERGRLSGMGARFGSNVQQWVEGWRGTSAAFLAQLFGQEGPPGGAGLVTDTGLSAKVAAAYEYTLSLVQARGAPTAQGLASHVGAAHAPLASARFNVIL